MIWAQRVYIKVYVVYLNFKPVICKCINFCKIIHIFLSKTVAGRKM
jgi:hypothetical protein